MLRERMAQIPPNVVIELISHSVLTFNTSNIEESYMCY